MTSISGYTMIVSILYALLSASKENLSFFATLRLQIDIKVIRYIIETILLNSLLFLGPLIHYFVVSFGIYLF